MTQFINSLLTLPGLFKRFNQYSIKYITSRMTMYRTKSLPSTL